MEIILLPLVILWKLASMAGAFIIPLGIYFIARELFRSAVKRNK